MKPPLWTLGFLSITVGLTAGYPLWAETSETSLARLQERLGIPSGIAKVVDADTRGKNAIPEIILIQDVHRHPEAQGNISAVLLYGARHWNMKDVYLEGAEAQQQVAKPAMRTAQELRDALYAGKIGGAEMASALLESNELQLHGMEEPALYKAHVRVYEEADQLRRGAIRELAMSRLFQSGLDVRADESPDARFDTAEKLLELRLKPAEYAEYQANPLPSSTDSTLSRALRTAELFYVLTDERSHVFTDVLTKSVQVGPRVAVMGGFHTAWIAEELKRQGKSYAVLSPQITTGGYDELYARGMQQTISALKVDSPL